MADTRWRFGGSRRIPLGFGKLQPQLRHQGLQFFNLFVLTVHARTVLNGLQCGVGSFTGTSRFLQESNLC